MAAGRLRLLVLGVMAVAAAGCGAFGGSSSVATSSTTVPEPLARSAGCGRPPPPAGEDRVTTTVDGVERWYLRHLPDGAGPWPLVVDLHGYREGAEVHARLTELGPYGEVEGFVTVTPHGTGDPVRWDPALDSADMDFLEEVLDEVQASVCVDPTKVFVTGLSNGAMMASSVGCVLARRVAAIGPIAGIRDPEGCEPARPVPVLAIHGTDDQFVTYDGGFGEGALDLPAPDGSGRTLRDLGVGDGPPGPSIPEIVAAWAIRNGCRGEPTEERVTDDVVRLGAVCPDGADVALLRVEGGGHAWPGSPLGPAIEGTVGKTTQTISANEELWRFFRTHPLDR